MCRHSDKDLSMTPEPLLRVPRQEPLQRRWRPPPAVSDSPLRYGSRARAKRALSPEVSLCLLHISELTLSATPTGVWPVSESPLVPLSTRRIDNAIAGRLLDLHGAFGMVEKVGGLR